MAFVRRPPVADSAVMLLGGCCRKIAAIVTLLVVVQLSFTEVRGDETERLRARVDDERQVERLREVAARLEVEEILDDEVKMLVRGAG